MKKIAIYGAGGFGKEIACMIKAINEVEPEWDLIGFFDDDPLALPNKYGKILGGLKVLNDFDTQLNVVFSIANPLVLINLTSKINNPKIMYPNIAAPNVNFLDKETLKIGKGNLFFFGTRVSCDVKIGNFNLLNGYVSLGHDVKVGDYNVFGPMVRISGNTEVNNGNFFGVQSIALQGIKIGNFIRVGANSVLIRNTKDNNLYVGNPAKIINL
jgi:sugar O-acyltransferase (sialic acid O-acetyltransferase NeuD family)